MSFELAVRFMTCVAEGRHLWEDDGRCERCGAEAPRPETTFEDADLEEAA